MATEGVFSSSTGMRVFCRTVGSPAGARAGALLLHGLGEHCGRHETLLNTFAKHGIYCRTFDWPGHGYTAGQRGHIASMEIVTGLVDEQLGVLRQEIGRGKPMGLLGHSMGGLLALYHLVGHPDIAKFAWIGSPLVEPEANVSRLKLNAVLFIERFCPRFPIHNGIKTQQCRRGPAKRVDPLIHRRLSVRLGRVLLETARDLQRRVQDFNPQLRLLMTHGASDVVCRSEFSRAFFDRLPNALKNYRLLDDALHEPYSDECRDDFYKVLEAWIVDDLCPALGQPALADSKI